MQGELLLQRMRVFQQCRCIVLLWAFSVSHPERTPVQCIAFVLTCFVAIISGKCARKDGIYYVTLLDCRLSSFRRNRLHWRDSLSLPLSPLPLSPPSLPSLSASLFLSLFLSLSLFLFPSLSAPLSLSPLACLSLSLSGSHSCSLSEFL